MVIMKKFLVGIFLVALFLANDLQVRKLWYNKMGVYSTVTITREEAIQRILELVETATNEELSAALFGLTQDHILDNYQVV